jgi:hypothetical protein
MQHPIQYLYIIFVAGDVCYDDSFVVGDVGYDASTETYTSAMTFGVRTVR